MKTEIHPEYVDAHVRCTCGNEFMTRSTKAEIHVEICSACHPFYTGRQKLVDTGGRVERFQRRVAKSRQRAGTAGALRRWREDSHSRPRAPLPPPRGEQRAPPRPGGPLTRVGPDPATSPSRTPEIFAEPAAEPTGD